MACSWMLAVQLNAGKKIWNVITITLLFHLLRVEEIISESSRQSFEALELHSSKLSPLENSNHKIIYESFDITYFQTSFQDEISNLWYFASICSLEDLNCVVLILFHCGDWRGEREREPQYPAQWSDSFTLTGERMAPVRRPQWRYQPARHKMSNHQEIESSSLSSDSVGPLIHRKNIAL